MRLLSKIFRRSKKSPDAALSRRLEQSIGGAGYWVTRMPRDAVRLMQQVQLHNIVAAMTIFTTGLLAWPLISHASPLTAQVVLSVLSVIAALTIAAPQFNGLCDRTEETIKLCGAYATIYGELLQAQQQLNEGTAEHRTRAAELLRQYENVAARKDAALALSGRRSAVRLRLGHRWEADGNALRHPAPQLEPPPARQGLTPPADDQ